MDQTRKMAVLAILASAATVTADARVMVKTIAYTAEDFSGEYCGAGCGIGIAVSEPSGGATILYSETGEDGTWAEEPIAFTNVCSGRTVHFQISAPNYGTESGVRTVTITPRRGVVVDITGRSATNMFDNTLKTVEGYDVKINDPLYCADDFSFTGSASASGIAVGVYPMGLSAAQFENRNPNFAGVVFNVKDGELLNFAAPVKQVVCDALGGRFAGGGAALTQECSTVYGAMPTAWRSGYRFAGWRLGVGEDAPEAMPGGSLLIECDHTLYAKWEIDSSIMPGGDSVFAWEAIDDDTARITGLLDPARAIDVLVLPDSIGGKAVVEISASAFADSPCGMTRLVLPVFCTRIGMRAFNSISALAEITFADVRRWDAPSLAAKLSIGNHAFSGTDIVSLLLPESVGELGDCAFSSCCRLQDIAILGNPEIGMMPFACSGAETPGVVMRVSPDLAGDVVYASALVQDCSNAAVRSGAVVKRIALTSFSFAGNEIRLGATVDKVSSWGTVDPSAIRIRYSERLGGGSVLMDPASVAANADGSFAVTVRNPDGESGFFQIVYQE